VGFNDPRKGVMGYYDLAREVRIEISKQRRKDGDASADRVMLEARLADLGIRVASALVEMGDLDGAVYHLSNLSAIPFQFQQLRLQKALLWLQLGDVAAARRCVVDGSDSGKIVLALSDMADGKYAEAAEAWKRLCETDKSNSLYSQNLAVCLLYSGLMAEVCALFKILLLDSFNKSIRHLANADTV
jgi:tetratricopeptide (TPR) repeat protein